MVDQKQLENVKCFKYLGSMLAEDGRCTWEIKSRIGMAKAAFNKKRNLFTRKLNLRKRLVRCYVHLRNTLADKIIYSDTSANE